MMDLTTFVNQPQYTQRNQEGDFIVTDDELLADAQIYEDVKLWRIQGKVRKTQVETAVIVYDTIDRLEAQMTDPAETEAVRQLAKSVRKALTKLYEYEFYINLGDDTVSTMFNNAKALGVLIEPEVEAITAAATYVTKPFETITIDDIRKIRYPAHWREVTVMSGNAHVVTPEGDLVSSANAGAFRFIINTAQAFSGVVSIRILAKKADDTIYTLQDSYPINISKQWEANTAYANVFKRVMGLSNYRHFKFEFIEPYNGAVSSVGVEGIA